MACGIWKSLNHGRVGICVEGQAAASARHWEGKGTANPRTLRVVERKLVCLQRHQNDDDLAFLSPSPPDTQVEEKQEKPTRNPVYFPFCFLSIFISALHPHPKKKKKSHKRHQMQTKIFRDKSRHQLLQTTILLVCHIPPPPCTPDLAGIHSEQNLSRTGKV